MKTIQYDPLAGTHIQEACKESVAAAINEKQNVQFSFNGVDLTATPKSTPKQLEAEFDDKMNESFEAAKARTAEILRKQRSVNTLLDVLKDVIGDLDKLMLWLKYFTEDADDVGAQFTKSRLTNELEESNWVLERAEE
jgi:hypothetical protein